MNLFAILGVLLVFTPFTPTPPAFEPVDTLHRAAVAAPAPLTFSVVGDSLTAGGQIVTTPDTISPHTWAKSLNDRRSMEFVGGYARPSTTSTEQAANVYPVDADVVLILSGTNDFHTGIGWAQHRADLDRIVTTVAARDVVLIALPPIDWTARSGAVVKRNEQIAGYAAEHGFGFVNPWEPWVAPGYVWAPGTTIGDGVHPTPEVSWAAGRAIADAVADRHPSPLALTKGSNR